MPIVKKAKRPARPHVRSIKIQPKYRYNKHSTVIVPEITLSGMWLEQIGFLIENRIMVQTSHNLIVIRPMKHAVNQEEY